RDRQLQPLWVHHVAAHFAQSIDLEAAANRPFELGRPDVVAWNDLYGRIKKVLGKRRVSVHLPVGLVGVGAAVAERLPGAPITRDQLKMLTTGDNVCDMTPALD